MASVPQLYSEYISSIDYSELLATVMPSENDAAAIAASTALTSSSSGAIFGAENYMYAMFDNGAHNFVPPKSDMVSISSTPMMNFKDGINMVDITSMLELSDCNNNSGLQGLVDQTNCEGYQKDARIFAGGSKFGLENSAAGENWRSVQNGPTMEESNIKVGRYSPEERKERIMRYQDKKNRRNFNKTIKYACRKSLADRRVRVRGRFARNNVKLSEEDMHTKKNNSPSNKTDQYYDIADQIKMDEENYWLQEMVGSLLYLQ